MESHSVDFKVYKHEAEFINGDIKLPTRHFICTEDFKARISHNYRQISHDNSPQGFYPRGLFFWLVVGIVGIVLHLVFM